MSDATSRTFARSAPIRVVVVEDSLVQRAFLVGVLEADGDIVVVGQATTGVEAIAAVAQLLPDVVTLDLQIPGGGGQWALEQIMALTPTPVVVLSGSVQNDRSVPAIDALVAGALLAVPKPLRWTPALEHELRRNVRMLRNVPVIRHLRGLRATRTTSLAVGSVPPPAPAPAASPPPITAAAAGSTVVAIGASTGGPPALATVLGGLGGLSAPVLVVQHLHADFVSGLVAWMGRVSPLPVVVAVHGQEMRRGCVYIAPGGTHLRLAPGRRIALVEQPATLHRPSVNELFGSLATQIGEFGIGVLLTGMGEDGAIGLAEMHRRHACTIAQDEGSCAVYGMPRAAVRMGAVDQLLPLDSIAGAIVRAASSQRVMR